MYSEEKEDKTIYEVVVNHEEQYSIWPEYKEIPKGWKKAGKNGLKEDCLSWVKDVWVDMRPISLRKSMEELEKKRPELERENARRIEEAKNKPKDSRDNLVKFLSEGEHPVEIGLRPEKSLELFKEAIDRGYVHVRFTDTRGGTELGVRLDTDNCQWDETDIEKGSGNIQLSGALTLNYIKVRCNAEINLETLEGTGNLESIEEHDYNRIIEKN